MCLLCHFLEYRNVPESIGWLFLCHSGCVACWQSLVCSWLSVVCGDASVRWLALLTVSLWVRQCYSCTDDWGCQSVGMVCKGCAQAPTEVPRPRAASSRREHCATLPVGPCKERRALPGEQPLQWLRGRSAAVGTPWLTFAQRTTRGVPCVRKPRRLMRNSKFAIRNSRYEIRDTKFGIRRVWPITGLRLIRHGICLHCWAAVGILGGQKSNVREMSWTAEKSNTKNVPTPTGVWICMDNNVEKFDILC